MTKRKSPQVAAYVPQEVFNALDAFAADQKRNRSNALLVCLEFALEHFGYLQEEEEKAKPVSDTMKDHIS